MTELCGQCGTEVASRFKVCSSCGAHKRRNIKGVIIAAAVGLFGLGVLADGNWALGLPITMICAYVTWTGSTQRWYRHNA